MITSPHPSILCIAPGCNRVRRRRGAACPAMSRCGGRSAQPHDLGGGGSVGAGATRGRGGEEEVGSRAVKPPSTLGAWNGARQVPQLSHGRIRQERYGIDDGVTRGSPGEERPSDDRKDNTPGHDKKARLRAILRAPEVIQALYRDGLVSQGSAGTQLREHPCC